MGEVQSTHNCLFSVFWEEIAQPPMGDHFDLALSLRLEWPLHLIVILLKLSNRSSS